ncbi:hypothetical protein [Mycobacterium tuberculosis]|uniref:hypothetical protein n=1 Tax=Mycobacterium tuberculosis TaxID=1773 RepID=UPI003458B214
MPAEDGGDAACSSAPAAPAAPEALVKLSRDGAPLGGAPGLDRTAATAQRGGADTGGGDDWARRAAHPV